MFPISPACRMCLYYSYGNYGSEKIRSENIKINKYNSTKDVNGQSGLRLNDHPDIKLDSVSSCLTLVYGWVHLRSACGFLQL